MITIRKEIERPQQSAGIKPRHLHLSLATGIYLTMVVMPIGLLLGPLYVTGVRAVLLVLFIPIAIKLFLGDYGKILITDILFFLHILWAGISLAVNNPDQAIQNTGSTGIEFIGGYLLGRAFVRSADDFVALIRVLVVSCIVILPFSFFEAFTGRAIALEIIDKFPGVSSIPRADTEPRFGVQRVQAVFAHPIHYGLFCTIAFVLCYVGLNSVYGDCRRWAASLLIGLGALLSLSSGALLAILLQCFLIFWAWSFYNKKRPWLTLLALFTMVYVVIDVLSNRTPIMVFLSYATFSPHTAYYRAFTFTWGMHNIWANPIFGIGLNEWVRLPWMHSDSVDNFWLLTGMRYGFPGFLLLAGGYLIGIWKVGRLNLEAGTKLWRLRRAWVFCFCGLALALCTVHIWHNIYSFVFFIFGAGMWLCSASSSTDDLVTQQNDGKTEEPLWTRGSIQKERLLSTETSVHPYTRFSTKKREP